MFQISQEINKLTGRDQQLLHLYAKIKKNSKFEENLELASGDEGYDEYRDLQSCWSTCRQRVHPNSTSCRYKEMYDVNLEADEVCFDEKASYWDRFFAKCLLNFCCCFFTRKSRSETSSLLETVESDRGKLGRI